MVEACGKHTIDAISFELKNVSKKQKLQTRSSEQLTNDLLDSILSFQKELTGRSNALETIMKDFEKLTWLKFSDIDLAAIEDIIKTGREVHASYMTEYIKISSTGFVTKELPIYKDALDDFKEVLDDVNYAFFIAPNDLELVAIAKKFL